jgi:DNA-binding transcriptional regulator YiaG
MRKAFAAPVTSRVMSISARLGVGYVPFLPIGLVHLNYRLPKPVEPEPVTIGDHVRRRRRELGMSQREAAAAIGIHRDALGRWEIRPVLPNVWLMPAVIRFLGYNPHPEPKTFQETIRLARRSVGVNQAKFARLLGVPFGTLQGWDTGKCEPSAQRQRNIKERLKGLPQK